MCQGELFVSIYVADKQLLCMCQGSSSDLCFGGHMCVIVLCFLDGRWAGFEAGERYVKKKSQWKKTKIISCSY